MKESLTGLVERYGGKSDKESIFSFIGEFLSNLSIVRSENANQNRKDAAEKISIDFTSSVNKDQNRKFKRNAEAIGLEIVEPVLGERNVEDQLSDAVFQNVFLIGNLPDKYFNDIQRMVFSQIGIDLPEPETSIPGKKTKKMSKKKVLQATPVEEPQVFDLADIILKASKVELKAIPEKTSLIEQLMEIEGINKTRATTIARDQTQKVFSALEEARGRDAGMLWYIWSGSDDNRERETHRANNNKIFHVDFPPEETGPPGQDINCRCRRKWLVSKTQIHNIAEKDLGYKTGSKYRSKAIEKLRQAKNS
ncbi:MAG: minor capsid protein [Candidatus Marinimicrobia bacterium]|nr:minor capsid protein [Candidatus Neomarinimicrobiota bacterium]